MLLTLSNTTAPAPWSLISPDNTWALWAVILTGVAVSIWLEHVYAWARKVTVPLLALGIAMILSNLRIMPSKADTPVYDTVWDYVVPLAVPLLLMQANVKRIVRESGWTFAGFHVCALGTLIGSVIAGLVFRGHVERSEEVAGILTGSYIGGAVNFNAIAATYRVSGDITGPLMVADNFIMAAAFAVIFWMAGSPFFRKRFPHPHIKAADHHAAKALADEHSARKEIGLLDIATSLAIAFAVAAAASLLSRLIQGYPLQGPLPKEKPPFIQQLAGNMYVLLTLLSVTIATVFHRRLARLRGAHEIGTFLLYIFLFVIGLPTDISVVITRVPLMFLFCLVIAVCNIVVGLLLGKLFRLNLEDILIGVNATLGGPPTAMAMAISMGWPRLALPGLLVGLWGYITGTALGIMITELLLRM